LKKNISFLAKVRVFLYWVFKNQGGVMEYCHYCKSIAVKNTESKESGNIYESKHKCLKCGAMANIREIWQKTNEKITDCFHCEDKWNCYDRCISGRIYPCKSVEEKELNFLKYQKWKDQHPSFK